MNALEHYLLNNYPAVKILHVTLVSTSGGLFMLRGLALLAGAVWPRCPLVKYSSYLLDTLLLLSGVALFAVLPAAVFENGWLAVKLLLLVGYILLGILAFRKMRLGQLARGGVFYLLALVVFVCIVLTALRHQAFWFWP